MQLELSLDNEPRALAGVSPFVHTTLLQVSLPSEQVERLAALVTTAVNHAAQTAYPQGERGVVALTIRDSLDKLEVMVRDFGLPQDIDSLEKHLQSGNDAASWLHHPQVEQLVDQVHWLAFGREGKALQFIKWLHAEHIADSTAELDQHGDNVPLAPQQQYTVRRMLPTEAAQVSQLMYRTYGNTYFNDDVYYPGRIAAQNEQQQLISVVAVDERQQVVAHCALERNQPGPTAEIGQAAVNPAHRGRGLLDRMKQALEDEARSLQLAGWYADAVAVHTFTQQSNAHHGGHVCGVDLAVSPKSEAFRGIAATQPQRVSCVLYFHWLTTPHPRQIFVPPRHREIVAAIYHNLQAPCEVGQPTAAGQEHGHLSVQFEAGAALATIRVEQLGRDSVPAVRHAVRQLVERSRAEVVVVELPLADPATPAACEALETAGLGFSGVGPNFSPRSDVLKLAYVVSPLTREPIQTFEPFAARVVDYALAEQARVRANW